MWARGWWILACAALPAAADEELDNLILDLISREPETRTRAARTLAARKPVPREAVRYLARLLDDSNTEPRDAALDALKAMGPEVLPDLVAVIEATKNPRLVRAVAWAMVEMAPAPPAGAPHLALFETLLRNDDQLVRYYATALLASVGNDQRERLIRALDDKDSYVRGGAAHGLAWHGVAVLEPVRRVAQRGSGNARVAAILCLGKLGAVAEPAVPVLLAACSDTEHYVREYAAAALGHIGKQPDTVGPTLVALLGDPVRAVRIAARGALQTFGAAAAPHVVSALGDEARRRAARDTLLAMGDVAVPALEAALLASDAAPVDAAVACLRAMRAAPSPATKTALRARLTAPDAAVRRAAAVALGGLAGADAGTLVALRRLAADPDPAVRAAAAVALWRQGGVAAAALAVLRKDATKIKSVPALDGLRRMGGSAAPALPDLQAIATDAPRAARAAAVRAAGAIVAGRPIDFGDRVARFAALPAVVRRAVESGLAHLGKAQRDDGSWAAGFEKYAVGVTGLAVLAHLAAGRADGAAAKGLLSLVARQDKDGVIGGIRKEWVVQQGMATWALCEAVVLTGDPRLRLAADRAIRPIEEARNPYMAWRYGSRSGENDTHITTWMVSALRTARLAGLEVDDRAFEGAYAWVSRMIDPKTGRVGYNDPGGLSARPTKDKRFPSSKTEAMSAAGLWCLYLTGGKGAYADGFDTGLRRVVVLAPLWSAEEGTIDLYYWQFGALTLRVLGDDGAEAWEEKLRAALVPRQRGDGSWEPVSVWSGDGGRNYATAMAVLALLGPVRYEPDFLGAGNLRGPFATAYGWLAAACADPDPAISGAAREACRKIMER